MKNETRKNEQKKAESLNGFEVIAGILVVIAVIYGVILAVKWLIILCAIAVKLLAIAIAAIIVISVIVSIFEKSEEEESEEEESEEEES